MTHTIHRTGRRLAASLALIALIAAGCSSTGEAASTVTSTATVTVTEQAATAAESTDESSASDTSAAGSESDTSAIESTEAGQSTESTEAGEGSAAPDPDACTADPADLAKITDAPNPSDPSLDAARDALYAELDCLPALAETATADELSVMMYGPDRGFTWFPGTTTLSNYGFAVSLEDIPGKTIKDVRTVSPAEIDKILKAYIAKSKASDQWVPGKTAIGGWNNPETGDVALNVSIVVDSAEEARQIGLENHQIAFFDMQTLASVKTK